MIKLRPAVLSDFKAIAKLHADNWRKNYRGILSDNYLDNELEKDRVDTWYKRLCSPSENQTITIATLDNNLAGFCCLYFDDDAIFGSLLDNLHVSSHLQRTGIGKLLVTDCGSKVYERAQNKKMYLWVYESNKNARIVYERLGGTNFETMDKENVDGTSSKTCRIVWDDVTKLL
ncbi:MAG TPA: GNAT family N-acetyltransferase [Chitinophagaceae bacterium]|nr:GNAT family N-acetyltransferase [Chitinophagaceae bacterium]